MILSELFSDFEIKYGRPRYIHQSEMIGLRRTVCQGILGILLVCRSLNVAAKAALQNCATVVVSRRHLPPLSDLEWHAALRWDTFIQDYSHWLCDRSTLEYMLYDQGLEHASSYQHLKRITVDVRISQAHGRQTTKSMIAHRDSVRKFKELSRFARISFKTQFTVYIRNQAPRDLKKEVSSHESKRSRSLIVLW